MVCVPCVIIPMILWVFYRFIQPLILKFWNGGKKSVENKGQELSEDDLNSEEYLYIQNKIKENPVMVFSKTTCGYCSMVKNVFGELEVSYVLENIDGKENCEKLQCMFEKMTGARTVPRVFIGGKCIGGGTDTLSLHNEGKLLPLLKEASAHFKKLD